MRDGGSLMTRREWVAGTAAAGLWLAGRRPAIAAEETASSSPKWRVGMCDWSMGRMDVSALALAREIGLDGMEVSVGTVENDLHLRRRDVQREYMAAAREHRVAIPSVAMGLLNNVPLMSEPRAALWVADTIEATKALGAAMILLAFFNRGELREENEDDMRRVTEVLQELAPRAERAGVVLGIETYLSAEAHLKILDQVKSPAVQVYYDVFNANHKGHDAIKEIRLLGRERICQVHFKEGPALLGSGKIDWPAVARTLKDIGYRGWLILETTSPNDVIADTRRNMQYLKALFES